MSRPDESITFLKDKGYCVLRLPRADARPLQTLLRADKKDLVRLGELASISVAGSNPLPPLSLDNVAPVDISGKESSATKIEVGVNILGGLIAALGGNALAVSAGFDRAKTMTFKFEDVLEDHVDVDRLDQYLSTCNFRTDGAAVTNALIDDAVFIITSTLKSTKFTVNAKNESGTKAGLEVPVVSGIASGKLSVDTSKATEGTVTFEGQTPVIFGFQAVQVFMDNVAGKPIFTTLDPLKPGAAAARGIGNANPTLLSLDQGAFFRLDDQK